MLIVKGFKIWGNGKKWRRFESFRGHDDTIHIICHSMGYAYALGIEQILSATNIKFGKFYVFAPENPSAGSPNYEKWKLIHQFGVNENTFPSCLQDLVAPQKPLKNFELAISKNPNIIANRFYTPLSRYCETLIKNGNKIYKYFRKKDDSHYIGYYKWVFDNEELYLR